MKIIYLHQYFNTPAMSGGTRSYEMARRLVGAGHEVHIITSWRDASEQKSWYLEEIEGIQVHWLPVPYSNHMSYKQRIIAFFKFAILSCRKSMSLGGDVIFATSTPLTIAIPAVLAAKRNKIPMVFEVRDLWPELPIAMGALRNPMIRWLAYRLERFSYKNSARVVALSPGMRDGVVATGYPSDKVHVIPNSSDLDRFYPGIVGGEHIRSQLKGLSGRKLVVYTGTFGHINGVEYFVRMAAAAKALELNLFFWAVGAGVERDKLEKLARELDVWDSYFLISPPVPKASVPVILGAADVACSLFLPIQAMWANSANKFFDSLASGTAIAINYGGWQADLLNRTNAGVVLDPNDPIMGAQTLASLLDDKQRLQEMGKNARMLAESEFSRDVLAGKLENVLRLAIKN